MRGAKRAATETYRAQIDEDASTASEQGWVPKQAFNKLLDFAPGPQDELGGPCCRSGFATEWRNARFLACAGKIPYHSRPRRCATKCARHDDSGCGRWGSRGSPLPHRHARFLWPLAEKPRAAARCEAHGTQRPKPIQQIGEEASTAQRRGWVPQRFLTSGYLNPAKTAIH